MQFHLYIPYRVRAIVRVCMGESERERVVVGAVVVAKLFVRRHVQEDFNRKSVFARI